MRMLSVAVFGLAASAHLLPAQTTRPAVIRVAATGAADFHTIQEAVDHADSPEGAIIRIAPGVYRERVTITRAHITLVGLGAEPENTVITWGDSARNTGSTFKSGTITASGGGFQAENLSIVNTWWDEHTDPSERSQAVALQLEGDKAVLDRVRITSGQDTLFANSSACHGELWAPCSADRQFFSDCFIEGNVDYIFGEAKAVFANCELHSRPHSGVMITAQSRHSLLEDSGYTMLHCRITGADDGSKVVLGRPWRDYATVSFVDTDIEQNIQAAGWSEWGGRLKTATYREYNSHGPGVNSGSRIVESPALSPADLARLNPRALLRGADDWDPEQAVSKLRTLVSSRESGKL